MSGYLTYLAYNIVGHAPAKRESMQYSADGKGKIISKLDKSSIRSFHFQASFYFLIAHKIN